MEPWGSEEPRLKATGIDEKAMHHESISDSFKSDIVKTASYFGEGNRFHCILARGDGKAKVANMDLYSK